MNRLSMMAARAAFTAAAVLLSLTTGLTAQVRPDSIRPDSLRADSLRTDSLRVDSGAVDTVQVVRDSIIPPKLIVEHTMGPSSSFGLGVWYWDQEALLREMAVSLGDLLERIPGIVTYRGGFFMQPETSVSYGGTAGRMEVVLDGYVLDPIASGTFDFSQLPLANIESIRVERRLDLVRISIRTLVARDGRPQSRIEAGVGEPNVNVFRGLLLMPRLGPGPLGLAVERVDTDGYRNRENADDFAAWVKWSYIRGAAGVQVEYLRNNVLREANSPWPAAIDRQDLVVRARAPVGPVVAELFAGRTSFRNDSVFRLVPLAEDSTLNDTLRITTRGLQWGGRASVDFPFAWAEAGLRFRDIDALPSTQVDLAGGVRIPNFGEVAADFTRQNWRDLGSTSSYSVRALTRSLHGLSAFGEIARGDRGATYLTYPDSGAIRTERTGTRFGAQFERWGITTGAALLSLEADTVPALGMPWDASRVLTRGGKVNGWEFFGRTELLVPWLTLEGSYTNWLDGAVWAYMPSQEWRAALQLHTIPLASGNLEILGRLETRRRGGVLMPTVQDTAVGPVLTAFDGFDTLDGYLQIRVADVRLFIRGENLLLKPIPEVPGRSLHQPRFMYGMKWNFWN